MTELRLPAPRLLVSMLLMGLLLTGCDSNDDGDAALSQDISAMFSRMQGALSVAFNPLGASKTVQPEETVPCPNGGSITVDGQEGPMQDDDFSFNLSMAMDDCNDLNGSITFTGTGSLAEDFSAFSYSATMNGSISAECTLNFNSFTQTATSNLQTSEYQIALDGSISAVCGQASTTCAFSGETVDAESLDAGVFGSACR